MSYLPLPQPFTDIHPLEGFLARGRAIAIAQARVPQDAIIAVVGAGNALGSGSTGLPQDVGVPLSKGYFYARRMRPEGLDAPLMFFTETDVNGKPYVKLVAGQQITLRWHGSGWILDVSGGLASP